MRCALCITYNGTHFFGSQIQKETEQTVLGELTKVFSELGINEKVVASGRTDRGVHATGQICHIDLPPFWDDLSKLHRVLNNMLPDSIQVKYVKKVADDFHARYSAKTRMYRYFIKTTSSNPFESDFITFNDKIILEDLREKIKLFVGEHDFKNYMKVGSDTKSTIRVIHKAFAYQYKDLIILNFEANGFLRSQVRLMVGALLDLNEKQIEDKLQDKKEHKLKPAPSNGLYLAKVKY